MSLFVVIEGIDGSGGTTQVRALEQWLQSQGRSVLTTCEPSRGPVGTFIRRALNPSDPASVLSDGVLPYLFAADRKDHLEREIEPSLESGTIVISDRYYHSSLAYQSLAIGMPAVAELNASFRTPDVTILLALPPEESLSRISARGATMERFEALDRLSRVRDTYEEVMALCLERGENILRVDASGSPDEVTGRVVACVRPLL
ncbi:MAG: dTMP kinase [Myxococcota bacterium]|jgi:dTMP kinase|nr:dTMP kinase [Myxococcota bacterium]